MNKYAYILLLLIGFSFAQIQAATYYVATNGNDNNVGSKDLPFATIGKAAGVAIEGDVVIIKSGTYKPSNRIQVANSGTANAPITFMAEVKDEAIIDGSVATSPTSADRLGLFTVLGTTTTTQNWILVDGLRIINSTFAGFYARYASNITFKNCSTLNTGASGFIGANANDIKVLNCKVQKACQFPQVDVGTNECITMASVNRFEIAYCSVSDRFQDLNNGGEGIDAKNESKDGSIHHNTVFDLVRLGIYIDAFQRNLSNIDVYANTVYNCRKGIVAAIEAGGTSTGVKIHDNIVYDNPNGGIQAAGYLVGGVMKDLAIYQNTVVRCGGNGTNSFENFGIMLDADNTANSNFVVRNNIVANCPLQIKTRNQNYITVDNNLLFGPSSTAQSGANVFGNPGTNTILSDPLFEDATKNNFRLKTGSPAIDKAAGSPQSEIDFYDFKRTGKGDLGAIEKQDTPAPIVLSYENAQLEIQDLKIYPNPSAESILVEFYAKAGKVISIEVIDLQGNRIQNIEYMPNNTGLNSKQITTEFLKNGMYLVRISDGANFGLSKKMVVLK
jgi:hypothetical protein